MSAHVVLTMWAFIIKTAHIASSSSHQLQLRAAGNGSWLVGRRQVIFNPTWWWLQMLWMTGFVLCRGVGGWVDGGVDRWMGYRMHTDKLVHCWSHNLGLSVHFCELVVPHKSSNNPVLNKYSPFCIASKAEYCCSAALTTRPAEQSADQREREHSGLVTYTAHPPPPLQIET